MDILYGDAHPRGQATPAAFVPDDLLDAGWFEGYENFSGTNRWVARTKTMDKLGISSGAVREHQLDPTKTLTGMDFSCFRLPSQLSVSSDEMIRQSKPCQVVLDADAGSVQAISVDGIEHLPSIPVTELMVVRQLVGSDGDWYYNSDEALFLLTEADPPQEEQERGSRQKVILGAIRECASRERLDLRQETTGEAYQAGSEALISNPGDRLHGKTAVITEIDTEMTGLLAVHKVKVQTSMFTHSNVALPMTQMIPKQYGFKPGQRVMTPDGPAYFLSMDIGTDADDHLLSCRVVLESQLTRTGIEEAQAGSEGYIGDSVRLYRHGELFTTG